MNCILIDDEPLARIEMEALIKENSDLQVVGVFASVAAALLLLKDTKVDLVFTDIEMPMMNGLELAAHLPENTLVIFTTAYSQYALDSYALSAIDYLMKPIDHKRLQQAIEKAKIYHKLLSSQTEKSTLESATSEFLLIKAERRFHRVSFSNILFIEGLKDYVVIHTKNQKLITAMNLKNIHAKIPPSVFLRISKSYIINLQYIDSFDSRSVMIGENELSVGEIYRKEFIFIVTGGLSNLGD